MIESISRRSKQGSYGIIHIHSTYIYYNNEVFFLNYIKHYYLELKNYVFYYERSKIRATQFIILHSRLITTRM